MLAKQTPGYFLPGSPGFLLFSSVACEVRNSVQGDAPCIVSNEKAGDVDAARSNLSSHKTWYTA